jgi:hypothetical protein
MMLRKYPRREEGVVLFVGLIMLILITLLAVSAIRLASTNLLVAGNEQYQMEAEEAANYHLNLALNADNFTSRNVNLTASLPAFTGTTASDATNYTVVIPPPQCKRYRYLKKSELVDASNSVPLENLACFGSSSSSPITIVVSAATLNDNSLCATSLWEMNADVELPDTGAKAQVTQGIEMRIDYAEAIDACK